jgi:hypothetical protein
MQRLVLSLVSVCAFATLLASASAQTPIGTANFIEWDLPAPASPGASGALEVAPSGNTRSVFYLTRGPAPDPRLIRFNPGSPIGTANATLQSWLLNPGTTGGLKLRPGEAVGSQTAFIRHSTSIVRLNTNVATNNYTPWLDTPAASLSDLALDLPSAGAPANIYTTGPSLGGGILQRLTPPSSGTLAAVSRWAVGGGAGSIYLSGVATRRTSATNVRVYWSEPTSNMIGELNPATNAVRRWLLPTATQPRQLDLDTAGDVWTVTGSGHLVRLRPSTGGITPYLIPTPASNPTGVGPDGFIGFTETGTNKVGMLIPDGTTVTVTPTTATIPPASSTLTAVTTSRTPNSGVATPVPKTGPATSTGTAATGIFVEAQLPVAPGLPSMSPIAIEDDTVQPSAPTGAFARAFFYSVSTPTTSRIGRVELVRPAPEPTTLDLNPPTAINPVDAEHCVTATVRDQYGEPMQGINVEFRVTGSVTAASGELMTNASGQTTFCYTGPAFPGGDAIHAWADWNPNNDMQEASEPFGDATKTWVFPVSTPGCEVKITNGGWIIAANTDRASFGGNAKVDADGNVSGEEEYQDHGPVEPMNAHGNVLVVTCSFVDRTQATIFGYATVDGAGSYLYRIDVKDLGEPGVGVDTYRFRLEPPSTYDSGEQILRGGNVQIHKN